MSGYSFMAKRYCSAMNPLRGTQRWISWLALALLACIPLRAAVGDAWLLSLGNPVCQQGAQEPCEEIGHGDSPHCHCLYTGLPELGRSAHGSMPGSSGVGSIVQLPSVRPHASLGLTTAILTPVGGPPSGSPFASRVGLTLHD